MVKSHILFDLDGTWIDSAPAILHSLEAVFAAAQRKPSRPLTVDLIGPPIEKIVQGLLTPQDAYRADTFIEEFKQQYDNLNLHLTYAYEGVPTMLQSLTEAGYAMAIATNKRIAPTRRILEKLGWSDYFDGVFSLDSFTPTLRSKSEMLRRLAFELKGGACLYVGDRHEDGHAAEAANLPFLLAGWGYGNSSNHAWKEIHHPDQLRPESITAWFNHSSPAEVREPAKT